MRTYHNPELRQINFLDERFYSDDGKEFFPSVTTILEVYPKGFGFNEWQKTVGINADYILEKAAREGSQVHDLCNRYLKNELLTWADEAGNAKYPLIVWQLFLKFVEFWTNHSPIMIASEQQMVSKKHRLGMTVDLVCQIDGFNYLIDIKTSNYIYKTHELQVAAYAEIWSYLHPDIRIDKTAVLHLKSDVKGVDKAGKKMQGKGWQLKEFKDSFSETFKTFQMVQNIWKIENPNYKPRNLTIPDRVQLIPPGVNEDAAVVDEIKMEIDFT